MKKPSQNARDRALIESLVQHARANQKQFTALLLNLFNTFSSDEQLMGYVHSMKWRTKDPDHLRDKLNRKWADSREKGRPFDITRENLFLKINDLAGFRILHLHTRQFEDVDRCLQRIFSEQFYRVIEGPAARTWDDESREYFQSINVRSVRSSSMYTSVHYIVAPNRKTKLTCEIQVRTLAEELWGEVDHSINYPHTSPSLPCREQLKVLARVTSSCTRLVDAIFLSHRDFTERER
jgi:ppGpp synthetase/RelA/SpoT-type nucleotidyltranferase